MILEAKHLSILNHTLTRAAGRNFCGEPDGMKELVEAELMRYKGKVSFAPDKIFTITEEGVKELKKIKNAVA